MIQKNFLHNPTVNRLLVIVGIGITGIASFIVIYENYKHATGLALLDQPTHDWLVMHRTGVMTFLMQLVTSFASPFLLPLLIAAGTGAWVFKTKEVWRPLLLLGSTAFAAILMALLKQLFQRSRPPIAAMVTPVEHGYSFPSGHTIATATFLLVLSYLICSRHRRMVRYAAATTCIGIVAVAMSRVYLGFHWLTDVCASAALSLVILAIVMLIDSVFRPAISSEVASNTYQ